MQILTIRGKDPAMNEQDLKQVKDFISANVDNEIHIFDDNIALRNFLINNGIEEDKIVMEFQAHYPLTNYFMASNFKTNLRFNCPMVMMSKMVNRPNFMPPYSAQLNHRGSTFTFNYDYVRYSTLTLVAEEINNNHIEGDIAELGVFRGEFATVLNSFFPDRQFHLFDTFEGFSEADVETDKGGGVFQ